MDPLSIQGDEDLHKIESLDDAKRMLNKLIDKRIVISSRKYRNEQTLVSCNLDELLKISNTNKISFANFRRYKAEWKIQVLRSNISISSNKPVRIELENKTFEVIYIYIYYDFII